MTVVPRIGLIVEGHGEVAAAPALVRRLLAESGASAEVLIPHRVPKGRMPVDLNRAVRFQLERVGESGGVLVLVDADRDDPETLKASLEGTLDPDLVARCTVVVATKEYEAWFLGGIKSLRGHKSVSDEADFPGDPEEPLDAKGRLESQMTESYQETIHQVTFSSIVDLSAVRAACPSFMRLDDCLRDLVGRGSAATAGV